MIICILFAVQIFIVESYHNDDIFVFLFICKLYGNFMVETIVNKYTYITM